MRLAALALLLAVVVVAGNARADDVCTAEMSAAMNGLISSVDKPGNSVLVDPELWDMIDFDKRRMIAMWGSHCLFHDELIFIKHGKTGNKLARYSKTGGYTSME